MKLRKIERDEELQHMQSNKVVIIGSGFGGQAAAINLRAPASKTFDPGASRLPGRHLEPEQLPRGGGRRAVAAVFAVVRALPVDADVRRAGRAGEYTRYVLAKHGLRDKTRLNANVTEVRWDDAQGWVVSTEGRAPSTRSS